MNSFFYKYVQFHCLRWIALLCITFNSSYAADHVYVTNSSDGTVSVIEVPVNTVVDTITVGSNPNGIAVTPDSSFVYVANTLSNNVSVIDTTTNLVTDTVTVGTFPFSVAVTPDGDFAYVTNFAAGSVSVIDTSTNLVTDTITVGAGPVAVIVTPDGAFAYVSNTTDDTVSVINTVNNTVTDTIVVGNAPRGIAVTPDGAFVYVVNGGGNSISVIDTSTNNISSTIPFPSGLFISISPDGAFAYASNTLGNVLVLDIASNTFVDSIAVGGDPFMTAFELPQGSLAYVAIGENNVVQVIDTANNMIVATIPVGSNPFGIVYVVEAVGVLPPATLVGAQKINDFALVYEIYNTLRWTPSPTEGVTGYNVYRDGVLVAALGPDSLSYQDHNRPKNIDTLYSVTARLGSSESAPISILIKSRY